VADGVQKADDFAEYRLVADDEYLCEIETIGRFFKHVISLNYAPIRSRVSKRLEVIERHARSRYKNRFSRRENPPPLVGTLLARP